MAANNRYRNMTNRFYAETEAEFYSEITGETYYTTGPFWQDGIPEEAVDAIEDAIRYTALMDCGEYIGADEDSELLDVVEYMARNL